MAGIGFLVALLLAYALLIAIPFVPGVELGLTLMMVEGAIIAPFIWAATLLGLVLAFAAGAFLPYPVLRRTLEDTDDRVRTTPWNALDDLAGLRSSVLVPIPGLLTDRYLGTERARVRQPGRRPPPSATVLSFTPPPGRPQ